MTTLMAIGGAMDKENPVVMREFLRRAGGENARIVSRLAVTVDEPRAS